MKHLFVLLATALFGAILTAQFQPVFASVESAPAAKLALHVVNEDRRATRLRAFLTSHDSPLTAEAEHFIAEADRLNLDWKLVAAISGVESTFGKFVPTGSYNGWGWGIFTGTSDGIHFKSWKDGITTVSAGLRQNYLDRGAVTIEEIGRIYAASPRWAGNVRYFLAQIEDFTPNRPEQLEVLL